MLFRRRRPYRRIYGVIGSCLCGALWLYVTVLFAATDRNFAFPLIAAMIFAVCAVTEICTYRKYGNASFRTKEERAEQRSDP
ncbi:MAG: hypothetical protein AB7E30_04710 [Lawsonibacter sp.]